MAGTLASLRTRRSAVLIVAFCCAWPAPTQDAPQPAPRAAPQAGPQQPPQRGRRAPANHSRRGNRRAAASQPASAPAPEPTSLSAELTVAEARRRLGRTAASKRTHEQTVLMRALDFALAIGQADGKKAAALLDAAGYQALPLTGDLPEKPAKPQSASAIEQLVAARPKVAVEQLPLELFEVHRVAGVRSSFPAIANWMLAAEDYAVVFYAPRNAGSGASNVASPDRAGTGWLTRDACIVIRLRADRPTILGGNLLAALTETVPEAATGGGEHE